MITRIKIIGAGVAGLSAGCYLQMNGYKTQIFESNPYTGGLCTSWQKDGYTIDGCINLLVGVKPTNCFYILWNELFDMNKLDFIHFEEFIRLQDKKGNVFRVFTDIDKLEQEMLDVAPEDNDAIKEFTNAIRKFCNYNMQIMKSTELRTVFDDLKHFYNRMPFYFDLRKWNRLSLQDYSRKFTHPILKSFFTTTLEPKMPVMVLILTLAWLHKKEAGYPVGGSAKLRQLLQNKYMELGGTIQNNASIQKVVTDDGKAIGLQLMSGDVVGGDAIISACDGYSTLFTMLDEKHPIENIRNLYKKYSVFPSIVQVNLGVDLPLKNYPQQMNFMLDKGIPLEPHSTINTLNARIMNYDSSINKTGHTVIKIIFHTFNYQYWHQLRQDDREKYNQEKKRISKTVIDILDHHLGNIKENIKMTDVSTPATIIRYTHNWKGSSRGWMITPNTHHSLSGSIPGLKNFYMTGQWVKPGGGIPAVMQSGREIAQLICRNDHKKFVTLSS